MMSFDDIMSEIRRWRTKVRTATGRPEAVPRDTINLLRQNLTTRLQASQQQTPAQVLQQGGPLPQEQGPSLLSGGRPIMESLRNMLQQQQTPAPQMSPGQIEYQKEQQILYQRAREKALNQQNELNKLKKRRNLSLG